MHLRNNKMIPEQISLVNETISKNWVNAMYQKEASKLNMLQLCVLENL